MEQIPLPERMEEKESEMQRSSDGKCVVFANYHKDGSVKNRISVPIGSLDLPSPYTAHKEDITQTIYPEFIGNNYELWEKYHEEFGPEAYKNRRLYEEAVRQLNNLYDFAEENGIELPNPGPSFS